jgi:hypothetical protein
MINAYNLGHKAWVFMATARRGLAHTMWWRHNNEDIPGESKALKQVVQQNMHPMHPMHPMHLLGNQGLGDHGNKQARP